MLADSPLLIINKLYIKKFTEDFSIKFNFHL